MRKSLKILLPALSLIAVVIVLAGVVVTPQASAKGKPGGGTGCPRTGIACTDVYDPVICSDGQTYGNACYAYVACATGCVSTGGGPQGL